MSCYAVVNAMLHPDLKPNEARLYAYLTFRANGERVTWPSVPEMEAQCHMERATVLRATKRLAELGLIAIRRRPHLCNKYEIIVVDERRPDFAPVSRRAPEPDHQQQNDPGEEVANPTPQETNEPLVAKCPQQDPVGSQNAHTASRKMLTSEVAKCTPEVPNKYPTLSNKERCFATAAPEPALPALPATAQQVTVGNSFWSEGVRIVRERLGMNRQKAGGMLRTFRDDADGSEAVVLEVLRAAELDDIREGFVGWVREGIKKRLAPQPKFSTPAGKIADKMGLNDPERRAAFWGDGPTFEWDKFEEAGP